MRMILLGTGTPMIDPDRQQSGLLVDLGGQMLLFDAGRGVTSQMISAGVLPQQVEAVFITHHHYDHISSLGEFLLTAWHNGRAAPLTVYGPQGTAGIVTALFEQVFARDIAFALFTEPGRVDIRDLVQVVEVASGWTLNGENWQISAEDVEHGHGLGLARAEWPCLGYRLSAAGKVIAISGDTVDCAGLDRLAQDADVLVQCCYLAETEVSSPPFERLARYVIASSGQVGKIAARGRVKKLVLTHLRPKSSEVLQSIIADVRQDYSGALVIAEDLMVIDV